MAYIDKFGVEYSDDKKTLVRCPKDFEGEYSIPNSVTCIGTAAFSGCTGLTSVTIPNSVTSIDFGAFCGCSSLTSVTIPNSVTSIGWEAFFGCSSLTSIDIPNSVTNIGKDAFCGCSSLTSPVYNAHVFAFMPNSYSGAFTIPDGIESIADGAFYKCSSLTSVTIPNSVTSIGDSAFYECSSLTSVTIPNSVTSIGWNAFDGCTKLSAFTFPNRIPNIQYGRFELKEPYTLTLPATYFSSKNNPEMFREIQYWRDSNLEKFFGEKLPEKLILIGEEASLDFKSLCWGPHIIYCENEVEELILDLDFAKSDSKIFVNNFIENVEVLGVDKWRTENLLFRAPSPSQALPEQNTIELTLYPRSMWYIRRQTERWSCPITLNVKSVTFVRPIEIECYNKNYTGSRLLLCGSNIDETHLEHLRKTETYPYIDVWEPYDVVCKLLKKGGWA